MKLFKKIILSIFAFAGVCTSANAVGWPANYDGVMLQGFYWDSYKGGSYGTTKWTDLTKQADELSKYFDLIWVPNSAQANGENYGGNGYMPVYWFSNHRCAYGTEAELKEMIKTFKAKGTGFIEDVVVNHRCGATNWWNFPAESWNGEVFQLTTGSITQGDEVWSAGQNCPSNYRGNPDTGEDFNGARDLDHTNSNVQYNVKNYCKFLLDELGYVGFRLDMVKGYGGQYTKIYNQYAKPRFSVGEYWDGNYDAVAAWIEATGRESAAFDFPCKYQINKALGGGENLTELVWKANGTTDQPAGLIHYGYPQLAVTFVDNHDTFRDGSKFTGNVVAANAFIIMSPGTPCVFWPHYYSNKTAIQNLIMARKAVGIHNQSPVTVLRTAGNLYVAEVTGTKGKAIVKIGSGSYDAPSGYKLFTSGNNYAVWTTTDGGYTPNNPGGDDNPGGSTPSQLYLLGNLPTGHWSTTAGVTMTKSGDKFSAKNATIEDSGDGYGYFTFVTTLGADWDAVNSGDRYGAESKDQSVATGSYTVISYPANVSASGANSWKIAPGSYDFTVDFSTMKLTIAKPGQGGNDNPGNDDPIVSMPSQLYVIGHIDGHEWETDYGVQMTKAGNTYKALVNFTDAGNNDAYFAFATILGADWDAVNSGDRYGASSADEPLALGGTAALVPYPANVSASGSQSWKVTPGKYTVVADFAKNIVQLLDAAGVDVIEADANGEAVYYNLQGVRVDNPTPGLYIVVRGTKVTKEIVR